MVRCERAPVTAGTGTACIGPSGSGATLAWTTWQLCASHGGTARGRAPGSPPAPPPGSSRGRRRDWASVSPPCDGELVVRRGQLGPALVPTGCMLRRGPATGMHGLPERERAPEVLQVRLPSRAVEGKIIDGQTAFLDDQAGPGSFLAQPGLDLGLVSSARQHRQKQVVRLVAHPDPAGPRPGGGEDDPHRAAPAQGAPGPPPPPRPP